MMLKYNLHPYFSTKTANKYSVLFLEHMKYRSKQLIRGINTFEHFVSNSPSEILDQHILICIPKK